MAEYRIEYSVQRAESDSDDFSEIGFGSSGTWDTPGAAIFSASSAIQDYAWETDKGMPTPESIKAEVDESNG